MARLRTVQEFLALRGADAPTPAELQLVAACQAGDVCVLGDGTRPEVDSPERRVRAELLRLLILGGTEACGLDEAGVWLQGAWINGALDLAFVQGRGRLTFNVCHFEQEPFLEHAGLDHLNFESSILPGLWAPYLKINGGILLLNTKVAGTVNVIGAQIGGQFVCEDAELHGDEGEALNGQGMTVGGSLFLTKVKAKGVVNLNGAQIGGQLVCVGAVLDGAGRMALNAQGVKVGGTLSLREIKATGTVDVNAAMVGGQLDFEGAALDGAGGKALYAQSLHVKSGLLFRELRMINGRVSFASAHIGDLADDFASWGKINDRLDLQGFTYDRIISAPLDVPGRLRWLQQGTWFGGTFFPQPYTQLAKTLAAMGHNRAARRVMREREFILGQQERLADYKRADGRYLFPLENLWADAKYLGRWAADRLSLGIVGYGHEPWRALIWMIGLWFLATGLAYQAWEDGDFAPNSDVMLVSQGWQANLGEANPADAWSSKGEAGQDWESFNRYAWGLDLVAPILDIGQTEAWQPSKDRGPAGYRLWWARWGLEIAGWLVSALGVAAITGIMQRDRA